MKMMATERHEVLPILEAKTIHLRHRLCAARRGVCLLLSSGGKLLTRPAGQHKREFSFHKHPNTITETYRRQKMMQTMRNQQLQRGTVGSWSLFVKPEKLKSLKLNCSDL